MVQWSIPQGINFLAPLPKSHFFRQDDPDWKKPDRDPKVASAFNLDSWNDLTFQGVLEEAITVAWWNPYDLLGLFLSILGPAKTEADKDNYFIHLTAVYAQWCSRVGGMKVPPGNVGVGHSPGAYQVTWKQRQNGEIDFCLGSALAGDAFNEIETGQWKKRVRRARFDLFRTSLRMQLLKESDFETSLKQLEMSTKGNAAFEGQMYGNCAETYPFIFSILSAKEGNGSIYGLSLNPAFIKRGTAPVYKPEKISDFIRAPCANCSSLIKASGMSETNFATPPPKQPKPPAERTMATISNPPDGWTADPDELDQDYYWGSGVDGDGDGLVAAKKVGLSNPIGQIIVDRYTGGDKYIFTANGTQDKAYIWNMITHDICEFTKPKSLTDVVAQMKTVEGKKSLEMELLHDVA
ncbi:hypothetical protein F4821DRAFT_873 [Hypoxylon rubiginosum]|uniref:Uncharacterized protein n=1 Tax=Hypoxylon rubiginosum TaxID=110542 RepID=A0ACC0DLL6_9PEZI|nr:hypothetical protein F4821DRAFT_873 [Hypoxylon rubiginosum]